MSPAHSVLLLIADGQLPAALRPAARENSSAVLRFHAFAETMLVLSLPVARLERALHLYLRRRMDILLNEKKDCSSQSSPGHLQ